jgi:hypothetical protein
MKKLLIFVVAVTIALVFSSCITNKQQLIEEKTTVQISSTIIADEGIKNSIQLTRFFMQNNPNANRNKVTRLAQFYITECAVENINSDIAFVQMCLETGFLRFGGLVTEDMNNFCGLGAIDDTQRGNSFDSELLGVRAHVQHLKGYGTTTPLVGEQVDSRYKWINPKGKAPDIFALSGTWAADTQYGQKLYILLQRLATY